MSSKNSANISSNVSRNASKKRILPKNRNYVHDSYTDRAFREGYKARSVFKLSEIDQQHKLLRPGMRVLDLGAAPGSWSRYVLQRIWQVRDGSKNDTYNGAWLCAVDLEKLDEELKGCDALSFFQADFTCPELQQLILPHMQSDGLFDVILSDMAPQTTGNRTVDTGRSEVLVGEILAVLPYFLKAGGTLLFKLFQGGGEQGLRRELSQRFASCQCLRPQAVRSQSFEIYFLCKGYIPARNSAAAFAEQLRPE